MKTGIIGGAGGIGSAIGFYLALKNIVKEIVLIDIKENIAKAHSMDIEQAVSVLSGTKVDSGEWEALSGCDIVIMAAGDVQHNNLAKNLSIVKDVSKYIVEYCPHAVVITATNPVDILNYHFYKITGMPARKFIGYSGNDSMRLRWAVARILGIDSAHVRALVIGEHGQALVPLFSTVMIKGKHAEIDQNQRTEIQSYIRNWFSQYEALQAGRTAAWTTAVGMGEMIRNMINEKNELVACSAVLNGQYGISGISIGVPVELGADGIKRIIELPVAGDELAGLKEAAKKLTGIIDSLA